MPSATYTSSTTVTLPVNSIDIKITVAGARGGNAPDAFNPRSGGAGAFGIFTFRNNDFTQTKTLQLIIPQIGGDGSLTLGILAPPGGTPVPGGSGIANGGAGGVGGFGFNCRGGSGGGAAGVRYNNSLIIVAGGGGGASSRSFTNTAGANGTPAILFSPGLLGLLSNGQDGNFFSGGNPVDLYARGGGGGGTPGGSYGSLAASNIQLGRGIGGGSSFDGNLLSLNSQSYHSGQPYITVEYNLYVPPPPSISFFTANPNPQNSTNGTPQSSTTLTWATSNASSVSINQGVGTKPTSGSTVVNTGLQSIAGSSSTSPRSITYTLTAYGTDAQYGLPVQTVSSSVTVQVRNDNTPSNISVASTATGGGAVRSLSNLEPNTVYYVLINYTKSSIDMPTNLTPATTGVNVSTDAVTWTSGTKLIQLNQDIYVQFTSAGFNTSTVVGGTNALGEKIGQTNTRTISIIFGTQSYSFNVTTRAPVIQETFDKEMSQGFYPYPDIDDVIPEPTLENYAYTGGIPMDDIEVPVEIKSNNSNTQIKINNGSWVNVRSI